MTDVLFEEKHVDRLGDLLDWIRKDVERRPYFRGQAADWPLKPSLFRGVSSTVTEGIYGDLASNLLAQFHTIAADKIKLRTNSLIERTIIAQHYGVPTSLIDFSENILVACHFACQEQPSVEGADGVIYILETSNSPKYQQTTIENLEAFNLFSVGSAAKEVRENMEKNAVIVSPLYLDERMRVQSSVFLRAPFDSQKYASNENILLENFEFQKFKVRKAIIKSDKKESFRDELKYCGIENHTLFPTLDAIGLSTRGMRFA